MSRPRSKEKSPEVPEKVRRRLVREAEGRNPDECWPTFLKPNATGYGHIGWREPLRRREELLHRVSFVVFVGPIPSHHDIHHECENPPCWNPRHLEAMLPGSHKGHHNSNGDYCRKGLHPWPQSAITTRFGEMHCGLCRQAWLKSQKAGGQSPYRNRPPQPTEPSFSGRDISTVDRLVGPEIG